MRLIIHIDGGSRGNPGPAAAGVAITTQEQRTPVYQGGIHLGRMTNNAAEYHALLHALKLAQQFGATQIDLYSDSQLLVRQINGQYRVKAAALQGLHSQAKEYLTTFGDWRCTHIRREQNHRADELANLALDAGEDVIEVTPDAGTLNTSKLPDSSRPSEVQFTVNFKEASAKDCPAPTAANKQFACGPQIPAGLCIYAAKTALDLMKLNDPNLEVDTQCIHCGTTLSLHFSRS